MKNPNFYVWLLLSIFVLSACSPPIKAEPVDPLIVIDAPLVGSSLTDGTHTVSVHGYYNGEVGLISVELANPGFVYVKYANPPGELVDDTYLVNFQQVDSNEVKADIPFPFDSGDNPANYSGDYKLQACLLAGPPQYDVIVCTDQVVYMPNCGQEEVALANDCIPAAVDATGTPMAFTLVAVPDRDVNCRMGPSASQFEVDDTLFEGVAYQPVAFGPDGKWLLFSAPVTGNPCWAFVDNLELSCNGGPYDLAKDAGCGLDVEQYPPTPTPSATPTVENITYATPTELPPQCADGIDNDGDGKVDYGVRTKGDPECSSPTDNNESK